MRAKSPSSALRRQGQDDGPEQNQRLLRTHRSLGPMTNLEQLRSGLVDCALRPYQWRDPRQGVQVKVNDLFRSKKSLAAADLGGLGRQARGCHQD